MWLAYNSLLLLAYPLIRLAALFSNQLRLNLAIRKHPFTFNPQGRPVIWFHAASVGEFEQARIVAQTLKDKHPQVFLFFTVYSYSAFSQRKDDPLPDLLVALPFDFPWKMKKILSLVKPKVIIYAKYDVWPNLCRLAAARGIPQYLISATLAETSARRSYLGKLFFRKVYSYLNGIYTIHAQHTARFAEYGLKAITAGDTRFEAAQDRIKRCSAALAQQLQIIKKHLPRQVLVMTAGSTYATSEGLLAEALLQDSSLFVILVPHQVNPTHIQQIENRFTKKNLSYVKYSELKQKKKLLSKVRALLVDTTGVLPYLYGLAHVAYVGGGFEGSLHSILEPAFFSLPILTGPAIANSQEALDLKQLGLLEVMEKAESQPILAFCHKYRSFRERQKVARVIARYYRDHLGVTKKLLPVIEEAAQLIPARRKAT